MKLRVFSTPRVSEPQCSRPKLVKSLRMSSRSLDDMSQCLLSFISVKIQGLIRAPLQKSKTIIFILQFVQKMLDFCIFLCVMTKLISPCNHNSRNTSFFCLHGILIRQNVSIAWENTVHKGQFGLFPHNLAYRSSNIACLQTKEWDGTRQLGTSGDIVPVSQFSVALLSGPAVQL